MGVGDEPPHLLIIRVLEVYGEADYVGLAVGGGVVYVVAEGQGVRRVVEA